MRSRYAAYALGNVDYLVQTLHPAKRTPHTRRSLEQSLPGLQWTGLTILATEGGTAIESSGIVEFEATYRTPAGTGTLHERSRFVREGGPWFYVDGDVSDREDQSASPTRGQPCPCGSGRKYKRCCGAR